MVERFFAVAAILAGLGCDDLFLEIETGQGDPCATDSDCPSGVCSSELVCCETECDGACLSCTARKNGVADGVCLPILAGTDPKVRCSGDFVCTGLGTCQTCADVPELTACQEGLVCIQDECHQLDCSTPECNTSGPSFVLADTNQRLCFDESGVVNCGSCEPYCGQDAEYGWDTRFAAADRYARSVGDEPVVTDSATGLEWRGCFLGLRGADCAVGSHALVSWNATHCIGGRWAGQYWRMPDVYELQSIVDLGRAVAPAIDISAFPEAAVGTAWTSSVMEDGRRWVVDLASGRVELVDPSTPNHVLCIRGGRTPLAERRWRLSVSGVAADVRTRLDWQRCADGRDGVACGGGAATPHSWESALSTCEGLELAGYSNWRLPNRVELASIVNVRVDEPGVAMADLTVFPATDLAGFWSSTSVVGAPNEAWVVDFAQGTSGGLGKDQTALVRCVRTKP